MYGLKQNPRLKPTAVYGYNISNNVLYFSLLPSLIKDLDPSLPVVLLQRPADGSINKPPGSYHAHTFSGGVDCAPTGTMTQLSLLLARKLSVYLAPAFKIKGQHMGSKWSWQTIYIYLYVPSHTNWTLHTHTHTRPQTLRGM